MRALGQHEVRLPWVRRPAAGKLPHAASYGGEYYSGEVLVALARPDPPPGRGRPRLHPPDEGQRGIVVRNCYARSDGAMMVENMRHELRAPTGRGSAVALARLEREGWRLYREPWYTVEPRPNFMLELGRDRFEQEWAARQYREEVLPTGIEAHQTAAPASEWETPTFRLFALHWKQARLQERWANPPRVRKLCALLGLTAPELAELIQWPPGAMERLLKSTVKPGEAPLRLPGPVAVWFHFLEATRLGLPALPGAENERKSA